MLLNYYFWVSRTTKTTDSLLWSDHQSGAKCSNSLRVSAPCSALLVLLKGVSMKSLVETSAGATVYRGGH